MSIQSTKNIPKLIAEYTDSDYAGFDKEKTASKIVYKFLVAFFSNSSLEIPTLEMDYSRYILDKNLHIQSMSTEGIRGTPVATYSDGSRWVVLLNHPLNERFCGFLYLQDALKQKKIDTLEAAPNKMAIYNKKIIYLSQYCGETRLDMMDMLHYAKEISVLSKIGFTDMLGGANLRKKDGKIFVFDTEKASFDPVVYKRIDAFKTAHDNIKSILEKN